MSKTVQQRVSEEANESPTVIKIGRKNFNVLPLTFGQLLDIDALVSRMNDITEEDAKYDLLGATLNHMQDVQHMLEMSLVIMFRNPQDREKNREYITMHLGEKEFTSLQELYVDRLNTSFFLTNIIFLKRNLRIATPTKVTPLGQYGTLQ